jgi:TRAP-type C4-dicarboxylate transport system permease small subunit
MAEGDSSFRAPADPVGKVLFATAAGAALAAGLLLLVIALLTTLNVPLKQFTGAPIRGEFEIVDLGVATAVFAFLPFAQLARGYVIVGVFTERAPSGVTRFLDGVAGIVFGICMAVVTWRMALGGFDIARTGDQTPILGLKLWWVFVVAVPSLGLLTVACAYTAWQDFRRRGP